MNSNKKINSKEAIKLALTPIDENEQIEFDAIGIQLTFLFKVQDIMDKKGISRSDLAEKMGTSRAYITQLFGAKKFINMKTIAKLQKILDIKVKIDPFEVKSKHKKINGNDAFVAEQKKEYS